jgi:hypothetical protein
MRHMILAMNCDYFTIQVKVTLRPTNSLTVVLGVRRPSGTRDQFFFLLEIFFYTVAVCYFVRLL